MQLAGDSFAFPATIIGGIAFVVTGVLLYRWAGHLSDTVTT